MSLEDMLSPQPAVTRVNGGEGMHCDGMQT